MTYRNAVLSLLTIAVLSIGIHDLRSRAHSPRRAAHVALTERAPAEVRVVHVDRGILGRLLTNDPRAAAELLGVESRAVDVERHRVLDVVERLAPLARGDVNMRVLSLRSRGRNVSIVVIAGPSGQQRAPAGDLRL